MRLDNIATPDELREALTAKCRGARSVVISSGGRRLNFYWLRKGQRLAVSVKQAPRHRAADALAKELLQLQSKAWVCPLPGCRVVFERVGRQKFCSPAHAARWRKVGWQKRQTFKAEQARRQAERNRVEAQAEAAGARPRHGRLLREGRPVPSKYFR